MDLMQDDFWRPIVLQMWNSPYGPKTAPPKTFLLEGPLDEAKAFLVTLSPDELSALVDPDDETMGGLGESTRKGVGEAHDVLDEIYDRISSGTGGPDQ
jgi:hypothetical protein